MKRGEVGPSEMEQKERKASTARTLLWLTKTAKAKQKKRVASCSYLWFGQCVVEIRLHVVSVPRRDTLRGPKRRAPPCVNSQRVPVV